MNEHSKPLVDDYLRRLDSAASALPAHRREELVSEIREHLQEALRQTPTSDEVAVRNLLERLGPPEEIVSAATDSTPSGQLVASVRETNGLAIASLLLGVLWIWWIGSLLALVFGYRARRQIRKSAGSQKGLGLASAGIVLGWIGIAILAVAVVGGALTIMSTSTPVPVPTP